MEITLNEDNRGNVKENVSSIFGIKNKKNLVFNKRILSGFYHTQDKPSNYIHLRPTNTAIIRFFQRFLGSILPSVLQNP